MALQINEYLHLIAGPNDQNGHFTTRLGKTFEFGPEDRIYLGLKELALSCQFTSEYITPTSRASADRLRMVIFTPYLCGQTKRNIDIDIGYYTIPSLVEFVNNRFRETLGPEFRTNDLKLWFNPVTRNIEFFVAGAAKDPQKRFTLLIYPALTRIFGISHKDVKPYSILLGAPNNVHFPNTPSQHLTHAAAPNPPTIKSNDLIFLYLNVLKKVCVGTELVSLADIFPKTDCVKGHSYLCYRTIAPKYMRLESHLRSLKEIEVFLATEEGEPLEIDEGVPTRVTLHMVSENNLPHF